jgi:transcription initiation factor TFIIH subunit 2
MILIIDMSASMLDRDMRPSRFELSLRSSREFVVEWFDQNPLGQIGIIGMRSGLGEKVVEMTGDYWLSFATNPISFGLSHNIPY